MSTLRDLVKDRKVYSIEAARTVLEAARFMMEHNIGALPVLRNGELAGIFSERDLMNRVVAVGRTPGLTDFGFRHLCIVEGKELRGLVSLRDILMHQAGELERQARRAAS